MIWTFSDPRVAVGDTHIDAACIHGPEYANGGVCSGIKYAGSTPALWAIWFSDEDMANWSDSVGFASAVDDNAQWRTDSTNLTSSWTARRWLPQEERSALYYQNEYRFTAGDVVNTYSLSYLAVEFYSLTLQKESLTLLGALSGLGSNALALTASLILLTNY